MFKVAFSTIIVLIRDTPNPGTEIKELEAQLREIRNTKKSRKQQLIVIQQTTKSPEMYRAFFMA